MALSVVTFDPESDERIPGNRCSMGFPPFRLGMKGTEGRLRPAPSGAALRT
ncbi:hypothetical protein ABIA32_004371 [Streptacidiphilus sp. MAP12-20]